MAFALVGAFAPSLASGAPSACSAWIGQTRTALSATATTFEITPDGRLRQLSVAPSVYSGAHSYAGWSRTKRAPHGGWTAYVRGQRITELTVERGGKRLVVDHDVQMGSATWSPNGGALAFSVRGARGRLARASSGFHVIAIHATVCSPYAWSRDSTRVAFVASTTTTCTPAPSTLDVVDAATGAIISSAALSAGVWSGPPTWSADGAFVDHSHLLTPGVAIVPRSAAARTSSTDDCTSARWSPIGHRLATTCGGVLTLIDARTGHQTALATRVPRPLDAPFWAADATALATMSDSSITVTSISRHASTIPFGGCVAAGILGFDRSTGSAIVWASVAPPPD